MAGRLVAGVLIGAWGVVALAFMGGFAPLSPWSAVAVVWGCVYLFRPLTWRLLALQWVSVVVIAAVPFAREAATLGEWTALLIATTLYSSLVVLLWMLPFIVFRYLLMRDGRWDALMGSTRRRDG